MSILISFYLSNDVFCIRNQNYCTGVPQVSGMFYWDSAPPKRLKTTDLEYAANSCFCFPTIFGECDYRH